MSATMKRMCPTLLFLSARLLCRLVGAKMMIADWSMTMATRMALTCTEMKKSLVSAARARKGLRMLARRPTYVRAPSAAGRALSSL